MLWNEEVAEQDERFRGVWEILGGELNANRLKKAQKLLDVIKDKDAEWHYVQAAVFFHKSWYLDCKKHLKKAVRLGPENPKYSAALNELTEMANEAKRNGTPLPGTGKWSDGCAEGWCEVLCNGCC